MRRLRFLVSHSIADVALNVRPSFPFRHIHGSFCSAMRQTLRQRQSSSRIFVFSNINNHIRPRPKWFLLNEESASPKMSPSFDGQEYKIAILISGLTPLSSSNPESSTMRFRREHVVRGIWCRFGRAIALWIITPTWNYALISGLLATMSPLLHEGLLPRWTTE